jgi:hypothetical protein
MRWEDFRGKWTGKGLEEKIRGLFQGANPVFCWKD